MTELAVKIEHQVLDSEIEALLVEAELIRAHQPYFNSRLKDDKSNIYLLITKEDFPKVLRLRKTDLAKKSYQKNLGVFGPFASAYRLNELLKIIRPIFRWCNQKPSKQSKACLYRHLDLCSGACAGAITTEEYQADIKQLIAFLRGRKRELLRQLKQEMAVLVKAEAFEQAARCRDKIQLIEEITSQSYQLKDDLLLPSLGQSRAEEGLLQLKRILRQHRLIENKATLARIEGYDVSNTMGQQATVSMVVLTDGEPDNSQYKFFKIRSLDTPNDYQMLQEALTRRQNHPEWGQPNLILIDGGKGQVQAVNKIWQWNVPVIGLVKNPDRLVLLTKDPLTKKISSQIAKLPADHPTLHLLERLRDEAHRFAKKQHVRMRTKNLLK